MQERTRRTSYIPPRYFIRFDYHGLAVYLCSHRKWNPSWQQRSAVNHIRVLTRRPNEGPVVAASKPTLVGNHSMRSSSDQPLNIYILEKRKTIPGLLWCRVKSPCTEGNFLQGWGQGSRRIQSMLLGYRLAELPHCLHAYKLNEAFYWGNPLWPEKGNFK